MKLDVIKEMKSTDFDTIQYTMESEWDEYRRIDIHPIGFWNRDHGHNEVDNMEVYIHRTDVKSLQKQMNLVDFHQIITRLHNPLLETTLLPDEGECLGQLRRYTKYPILITNEDKVYRTYIFHTDDMYGLSQFIIDENGVSHPWTTNQKEVQ